MNWTQKQFVQILFLIGILLHFIGLSNPRSVVFDEVHFGKFVTSYCCTSENIFDIHPPHAKLLIAGATKLSGYKGNFDFDHISEEYKDVPILGFRFFPAVWGVLIPIAFFYLLVVLGASLPAAFLGGIVLAFDNALLIQTRVIALDGLLILSILASLIFYFLSRREGSLRRKIIFWSLTGASAAMAVGTKFIGLVSPFLLLALLLKELFPDFGNRELILALRKIIWMGISFVVVYFGGWWLHFSLLTQPGPGDRFYRLTGNFMQDTAQLHRVMLDRNAAITTKHPDASLWYQWPSMYKPVYYWSSPDADMYFVGNPVVWWGASILFLIFLASLAKWKRDERVWLAFVGFLVSFLPFVPVKRPLFLYHFLTPLVFILLTIVLWLDSYGPTWMRSKKFWWSVVGVLLLGFILMSPVTFGWPRKLGAVWLMHRFPHLQL